MTESEAIIARHSVRQYLDKPIEAEKIEAIQESIDICNREGGVHIQLVTNEPKAFSSLIAKYGRFRNVSNYIAVVAPKGRQGSVSAGYWGERLVLALQMLDLRTCWVGASYKKDMSLFRIGADEELKCVISFGYGANDGVQHPQKRTIADVAENKSAAADFPDWFVQGVEAALLAPTAVNQQKFKFILHDDNRVEAVAKFSLIGYSHLDLGIAKCHFEVGAGKDFAWI
ncbi:MAG: nitroreductase [Bacteroidales bacterium]|nr:nitroreductase [Bacteroidales bacterium]